MRLAFLLIGLALAGATGCAQCDTCDDFPAPCAGPNCGGGGVINPGAFVPPTQDGLPYDAARTNVPVETTDPASTSGPTDGASGLTSPPPPPANAG